MLGNTIVQIIEAKLACHIGFNPETLNYTSYLEVRGSNALDIIEILSLWESQKQLQDN